MFNIITFYSAAFRGNVHFGVKFFDGFDELICTFGIGFIRAAYARCHTKFMKFPMRCIAVCLQNIGHGNSVC